MAYDKEKLFERAKELIESDENIVRVNDVIILLGIVTSTFYLHFPVESKESEYIKSLLVKNKVGNKLYMLKKWRDSENVTAQLMYTKLMLDDDERKALSTTYQDSKVEHSGEIKGIKIGFDEIKEQEDDI
jgi:hypothetical protein